MKKSITIIFLLCSLVASAQSVDYILNSVETNNTRLRALREANAARMAELKADNTIGETSVEYSPFYQKGYGGMASSELIVQQEFDFPTLYGARSMAAAKQQRVVDTEYLLVRRDVMLEALNLCFDLATANENGRLIEQRLTSTNSLLEACNKRLEAGDATVIELNRIKMDRMALLTEATQNAGEKERLQIALQGLGAKDVELHNLLHHDVESLSASGIIGKTQESALATASLESAQQDVKVQQQGWLPKLSVGYRRNTEQESKLNGFLVGVSMPLFSNSQKVKAARLRRSQAEAELDDARNTQQNRELALRAEVANLQHQIEAYDGELMQQSLSVLMKAVEGGQMSVTDYYTEADRIHSAMQQYITIQNRLYKAKAELDTF